MRMEEKLLVEGGRQMGGGVLLVEMGKGLVLGVLEADAWAETHIMPSVGMRDH